MFYRFLISVGIPFWLFEIRPHLQVSHGVYHEKILILRTSQDIQPKRKHRKCYVSQRGE